jgi:hypothetical protein
MPRCSLFSTPTLLLIGVVFVVVSVGVTVSTVNNSYGSSANDWVLVGALTSTSASFRIRGNGTPRHFFVSSDPSIATDSVTNDMLGLDGSNETAPPVWEVNVGGLEPHTRYYYRLRQDAASGRILQESSFRTPGNEGIAMDFSVVAAGCSWTGSDHAIYDVMAQEDSLLMLHLGDLHYEDIAANDLDLRLDAIDKVLGSPSQQRLLGSKGLVYIWDDHDWLGNDSGGNETEEGARDTALESYTLAFPHYPLPSQTGRARPPFHAFTIGTVRFVVSDLRSEATANSAYSREQRTWLLNEISLADDYDYVIWMTSRPWIGEADAEQDNWRGYEEDRRELSQHISSAVSKGNFLAISSDAHMMAFDDGTNTYYGSSSNATSFPILQTGPMDRLGSTKGGPFTEGCHTVRWKRNHQFAKISFEVENVTETCLVIETFQVDGNAKETIFMKRLCGNMFRESSAGVREGSCDMDTFERSTSVRLFMAIFLAFAVSSMSLYWWGPRQGFLAGSVLWASIIAMFFVGLGIPIFGRGIAQFDLDKLSVIILIYTLVAAVYLSAWWVNDPRDKSDVAV